MCQEMSEVELAIGRLKSHKSPSIVKIPSEQIKAGGRTIRLESHKLITSVLFFTRAIFKLYICIPTNCTQLIYFINNTLKHMYCLKL